MALSTATGSTCWSKAANNSASRRLGPPSGWRTSRRGAGVPKVQEAALARLSPPAARVPAGTVTWNSVAIAKRPCGSNRRVRVPTQRHSPRTCGCSRAGTASPASSPCEVTATIGWEKVIESCGASGTSPSGARRSTVSGPLAVAGAAASAAAGGNGVVTVFPVRGAGSESSRLANASCRGSSASAGSRCSKRSVSACASGCAAGRARGGSALAPESVLSLRRNSKSGRLVLTAASRVETRSSAAAGILVPGLGESAPETAIAASAASVAAEARSIADLPCRVEDTAKARLSFRDKPALHASSRYDRSLR